jgi:hypothetical protein
MLQQQRAIEEVEATLLKQHCFLDSLERKVAPAIAPRNCDPQASSGQGLNFGKMTKQAVSRWSRVQCFTVGQSRQLLFDPISFDSCFIPGLIVPN